MSQLKCDVCGKTGEKSRDIWMCRRCDMKFCKEHAVEQGATQQRIGSHEMSVSQGGTACPRGHVSVWKDWDTMDVNQLLADLESKPKTSGCAAVILLASCGVSLFVATALVFAS